MKSSLNTPFEKLINILLVKGDAYFEGKKFIDDLSGVEKAKVLELLIEYYDRGMVHEKMQMLIEEVHQPAPTKSEIEDAKLIADSEDEIISLANYSATQRWFENKESQLSKLYKDAKDMVKPKVPQKKSSTYQGFQLNLSYSDEHIFVEKLKAGLTKLGLIAEDVKLVDFRKIFTKNVPVKVNWKGELMELVYVYQQLIQLDIIVEPGQAWVRLNNCFIVDGSEINRNSAKSLKNDIPLSSQKLDYLLESLIEK